MKYHIVGQWSSSGHIYFILSVSVLWVDGAIWKPEHCMDVMTHALSRGTVSVDVYIVSAARPSDKQTDPLSFKSSPSSGVLSRSSSGLRPTGDSFPGDEVVNTAGPPLGGGISIPIRRYFLRRLLIHVCQLENTKGNAVTCMTKIGSISFSK